MLENIPVFETAEPRLLRIVFQHTKGPLAGLHAIMGLTTDFGIKSGEALPTEAEGFEAQGRIVKFAGLVKVTSRYALYREPIAPKKLKGFNPEQV